MFNQLKNIILKIYLRFKNKKVISRIPISLQAANKIGIIFHGEDVRQNDTILAFVKHLKSIHKDVQLLGYLPKREFGFQYPFPFISNKDTTWYGKPGGGTSGFFTRDTFDLMINFCADDCLPLEYISANSMAKFRVGFNKDIHNTNYDLILISNEKSNISKLISNLENYLK
ncbi:MAG TPA: hypothetical protein PLJ42_10860 [Chitinophagales bacterium]|nr:hypothetical protein [Chitinophagales bacterium]HQV79122.1 hypothetical protein [Chitinophagales bacterium]HQW79922.1 hypothetical protein [Chitinophagales bacterium]HRB67504.1 hypothetical protein [Chitinophagales bacterium]HRB92680.1 hypothetical protein [Chitinophagales bacterium]